MWVLILILHLYPHNSRWPTIPIQLYQAQWRDRVSGHLLNHLLRNLRDHGCCFGGFESQLLNGILEDRSTILTIQPKSFWARGWRNMVTRLPAKHESVGGEWTKTVAMRFSGRPYVECFCSGGKLIGIRINLVIGPKKNSRKDFSVNLDFLQIHFRQLKS